VAWLRFGFSVWKGRKRSAVLVAGLMVSEVVFVARRVR
jgi:hypothetical protein